MLTAASLAGRTATSYRQTYYLLTCILNFFVLQVDFSTDITCHAYSKAIGGFIENIMVTSIMQINERSSIDSTKSQKYTATWQQSDRPIEYKDR